MSGNMDSKDELVQSLKAWIQLDQEIRTLRAHMREKLAVQKGISASLIAMMKENEIDVLNTSEVNLACVQRETKKPITKKYLEAVLLKFYDNNSQKATEMQEYILGNRETTVKDYLKTSRT